jgi:hypothetical protein
MDTILYAIAMAVVRTDSPLLARNIRMAYEAGATVGQVFAAIELGHCLGRVPVASLELAWAAARGLARIARPGLAVRAGLPPRPVRRRARCPDRRRPGSPPNLRPAARPAPPSGPRAPFDPPTPWST